MAKELDGILDSSDAETAKSCTSEGSTSFLERIITPIYDTMAEVGSSIKGSILICLFLQKKTGLLLDLDQYGLPTCISGYIWIDNGLFGVCSNTIMYSLQFAFTV